MPTRSADTPLKGIDRVARAMMDAHRVPGLALAVVRGGRTVLARGYGWRDRRAKRPVTPDTLFAVGSCTKAITATALGMLVDEKKLDWDAPVRDALPSFRLADPVATERTSVRDLLCHRTGLPRHDSVWYGTAATRWELLDRLRHLELSKDFRHTWQYQNLMYMVAGLVVEAVSGRTWEQFVSERILTPLGMTRTNLSVAESQQSDDFAAPYARQGRRVRREAFYVQGPIAPAGAINSSAADMAKWLTLNLRAGRHGRRQLVAKETLAEIHTPQVVVPDPPAWPELLQPTYAIGWNAPPYRGEFMLAHGGAIDGFQAHAALLPKPGFGVVVLTNLMGHPVSSMLTYYVLDRLLGVSASPWPRRARRQASEQAKTPAKPRAKGAPPRPSKRLAAYAGEYRHDGYGALLVRLASRRLRATFWGADCSLEHDRHDVFQLVHAPWNVKHAVSFLADADGRIDRLTMPLEPTVDPIVFRKVEAAEPPDA